MLEVPLSALLVCPPSDGTIELDWVSVVQGVLVLVVVESETSALDVPQVLVFSTELSDGVTGDLLLIVLSDVSTLEDSQRLEVSVLLRMSEDCDTGYVVVYVNVVDSVMTPDES